MTQESEEAPNVFSLIDPILCSSFDTPYSSRTPSQSLSSCLFPMVKEPGRLWLTHIANRGDQMALVSPSSPCCSLHRWTLWPVWPGSISALLKLLQLNSSDTKCTQTQALLFTSRIDSCLCFHGFYVYVNKQVQVHYWNLIIRQRKICLQDVDYWPMGLTFIAGCFFKFYFTFKYNYYD